MFLFFMLSFIVLSPAFGKEIRQEGTWVPLGPAGGNIKALEQDPSNPNIFYAAPAGTPCRFHKSTDHGATWTEVSQIQRGAWCMTVNPSNGNVYLCTTGYLHMSTNDGATWQDYRFPNTGAWWSPA